MRPCRGPSVPTAIYETWALPIGRSRGIMPHTCSRPPVLRLGSATCMTLSEADTRTPEELPNLMEAKGREIAETLAVLRRTCT